MTPARVFLLVLFTLVAAEIVFFPQIRTADKAWMLFLDVLIAIGLSGMAHNWEEDK